MNSLLVTQLACAFTPAILGLAIAAATSPRMFRLLAKTIQFDLTSLMLLTAALAVLFALNRAMVEISHESWQEYQREMAYWRANPDSGYEPSPYSSYYDRSGYQIGVLICCSVFTVPGLIFARILIDGACDERRTREERRQRQLSKDSLAAMLPRRDPPKPQWID